jgi:hypothetical protein
LTPGGNLDIFFDYYNTRMTNMKVNKIPHEKKDKNGKLISRTYTYKIEGDITSTGKLTVQNHLTNKEYKKQYNLNSHYTSKEFRSYREAKEFYDLNRENIIDKFKENHINSMIKKANYYVDNTYGYNTYKGNFYLEVLKNKKHPEYENHNEAYNKVRDIFSLMKYNEPVEPLLEQVEPVIEYYKKTAEASAGKKKNMRKMRYASYFNIANIYYYLDQLDKAAEYGRKIIENDYNKKKGKKILSKVNNLKNLFDINKVNTRHFEVITEDLTNSNKTGVDQKVKAPIFPSHKYHPDPVNATVITSLNNTLKGYVDYKRFNQDRYAGKIYLITGDNNGKIITKSFTPSLVKLIILENGEKYRPVSFKQGNEMTPYAPKRFVKILLETDKIQLYQYSDKEVVLKKPDQKKGTSNLSMGFVVNFKKQLRKFAGDCEPLLKAIKNKEFSNNPASLVDFCKRVSTCE